MFAIALATNEKVSRTATRVGILILLWIIFQSTLSLNRWYMDRKTAHLLFPVITTAALVLCGLFMPVFRTWREALKGSALNAMHLLRILIAVVFWWASEHKQAPSGSILQLAIVDAVVAILATIFAFSGSSNRKFGQVKIISGYLSLTSLAVLWTSILLSAPSLFQQMAFESPNYLVVHFPGSWIPSFVMPLLIFAQGCSILSLNKQR